MDVSTSAGRPGTELGAAIAAFGTDWLYVVVPLAGFVAVLGWLARRSPLDRPAGFFRRMSHGAAARSGLPAWCAGPLVILVAALGFAVGGFFWDVAWHIDVGRDEFLFSPPHTYLLLGLGLLAVAGAVGATTATRDGAQAGWRVDRWRVPYGAAALGLAGCGALAAFGVDELWHWAYGIDVTMWSPPHLTMVSAGALSPMAGWVLLAEAGPDAGHRWLRRTAHAFFAAATLVGLSAWQLEFDLGVPQWQQLYHPVLVAIAAGFGLTAARAAFGRGGALAAVVGFLGVRAAITVATTEAWGLSQPRFVPYLAAAVAVELAFAVTRSRTTIVTALVAGAGVGTLGLAGAWAFTHVWSWHPWQPSLFPAIGVAALAAVGATTLGTAFGRVVGRRPSGMRPFAITAGVAAVLVALAVPLPRNTPAMTAEIRTTPADPGWAHVAVDVSPPGAAAGADRFEILAWQGQGRVLAPLVAAGPDRYRTEEPVPVHGDWKTMVRFARGADLGGIPVAMPADPEIGAEAVPAVPVRTRAFAADDGLMLREATDGPAWPGVIAYTFTFGAIGANVVLLLAGAVALERRRRAHGWSRTPAPLSGRRVLLTGAAGGIGTATRAALEAQGARVIGLDLHPDRPDTLAVDVRDADAVTAAVAEAVDRLGGLDIVVANAGIGRAGASSALPDGCVKAVIDTNFFGAWHVVAAAAGHLAPEHGQVVVVGSGLAVATVPFSAAYTASKRALAAYADVLRMESAITVSTVHPGYIPTPIHDGPRADGLTLEGTVRRESPADAAAAIVTACETGRRELGSSPLTTAELAFARHFPAITDRVLERRWRRTGQQPRFQPGPHTVQAGRTVTRSAKRRDRST